MAAVRGTTITVVVIAMLEVEMGIDTIKYDLAARYKRGPKNIVFLLLERQSVTLS